MKNLLMLLLMSMSMIAHAWEPEPGKSITVTVPNPPGSGNEITFRKLTEIINKTNKSVRFIVVNQPGADGVIALNALKEKTPDGYNIMAAVQPSTVLTNDIWEKNAKKFEWNTFSYAIVYGRSPLVLVANHTSRVNTPEDFVRLVTTADKPINVAIGGGAHRTAFEYIMHKHNGKSDMVKTVNFQGPLQVINSVAQFDVAGTTEFGVLPIAIARPMIEAGKVKPIGLTGTQTLSLYPKVPLLSRVTPGNTITASWFIVLPPNTPKDIVDWYSRTFAAAMRTTEYKEWTEANAISFDFRETDAESINRENRNLRSTYMPLLEKIDITKN